MLTATILLLLTLIAPGRIDAGSVHRLVLPGANINESAPLAASNLVLDVKSRGPINYLSEPVLATALRNVGISAIEFTKGTTFCAIDCGRVHFAKDHPLNGVISPTESGSSLFLTQLITPGGPLDDGKNSHSLFLKIYLNRPASRFSFRRPELKVKNGVSPGHPAMVIGISGKEITPPEKIRDIGRIQTQFETSYMDYNVFDFKGRAFTEVHILSHSQGPQSFDGPILGDVEIEDAD